MPWWAADQTPARRSRSCSRCWSASESISCFLRGVRARGFGFARGSAGLSSTLLLRRALTLFRLCFGSPHAVAPAHCGVFVGASSRQQGRKGGSPVFENDNEVSKITLTTCAIEGINMKLNVDIGLLVLMWLLCGLVWAAGATDHVVHVAVPASVTRSSDKVASVVNFPEHTGPPRRGKMRHARGRPLTDHAS